MAMHDIMDKAAKLLALAESTTNPHEAEAFTAKAEELMLQHGIEEAMVAARRPGTKADAIIIERIRCIGQYRMALSTYGACVAPTFSLKSYRSVVSKKEEDIWLVGHQSDVEQATILVQSLLVQSQTALAHWWRTEGEALNPPYNTMNQYLAKRHFLFAFSSGVRERLSEVYNRVVNNTGPGTELVLFDRAKMVEDWIAENMGTGGKKHRALKGGSYSAVRAGHAAGREAVGNKRVEA